MDIKQEIQQTMGISPALLNLAVEAETEMAETAKRCDAIASFNQYKVLAAFRKHRVSDSHFGWHTGYGYDDPGREVTERVYAEVFGAEKALVRTQIVNGTHALSLVLSGLLRPGDEMIYATGAPYDTLEETIGIRGNGKGSLKEFGIGYKQVELLDNGDIDVQGVLAAVSDNTKMICLQRATGYAWRKALSMDKIADFCGKIKEKYPDIILMADNCYGEFLDIKEPTQVGVDIMAGSLIKNPGGGLALSGGYVAGREELVETIAGRLTAPGIGGECGLTFGQTRSILQGFFLAPTVVAGAIKGAELLGVIAKKLGFEVCPEPGDVRSDIIQAVKLRTPEALVSFCKGVQSASPVDAFVEPEPWDMPGYEDPVIMAAGAFVQGSSIELSADGPLRDPYTVYFQGGLTYDHSKIGVLKALQRMIDDGVLTI